MTDGEGTPLGVHVTAGQAHESTSFEQSIEAVKIPEADRESFIQPQAISGDKAYSCKRIRDYLKEHAIQDVIPAKSNEKRDDEFDQDLYRRRNVVERCIGWLKECRRITTRAEKLAVRFLGMLKLAIALRCFRVLSDRA